MTHITIDSLPLWRFIDADTYNGVPLEDCAGTPCFRNPALFTDCNIDMPKMAAFMRAHGLKHSSRTASFNHLLNGVRGRLRIGRGTVSSHYWDEIRRPASACMDHVNLFYRSGASRAERFYVITTQPYTPSLTEYQALEHFCATKGLECSINYSEAWHSPGATPLIIITRAGDLARLDMAAPVFDDGRKE